MAQIAVDDAPVSILDRTIDLTRVGWVRLAALVTVLIAVALRFAQLDQVALSPVEGRRAFQALSFVRGTTAGPGLELPDTSPAYLILQALSLFLFGPTDTAVRVPSMLLGVGIVILAWQFWPFVGRARALGMAALAALSPTLVYSSRVADVQIAVAFFALLAAVALLNIGRLDNCVDARHIWSIVAGVALAAAFASGPAALSVLLSLAAGAVAVALLEPGPGNAVKQSLAGLQTTPRALVLLVAGFVITLLVLFTRLFSDLTALAGIGDTFADWGRLIATSVSISNTPVQFFLLSLLLYETLAIAFAVAAANWRGPVGNLGWTFFVVWFTAALLLFSFSSGRAPEHAILVALPLVLLGGAGLGDLVASIDLRPAIRARFFTLLAAILGFGLAVIAFGVLVNRVEDAVDQDRAVFQAIAVAVLAVVPLGFAVLMLSRGEIGAGTGRRIAVAALTALALFLGGYTLRSTMLLSFFNADSGVELLAQQTSTPSVHALMSRLNNLSRDVTVLQGSPRDPTGGHGLTIAIDRRVQHPLRWYFRDYPDAEIVASGQAPDSAAQVVIAPDDAGMAEAGYTPRAYPTLNRVPAVYTAPDIGDVLKGIFLPNRWGEGVRYVILRELDSIAPPESLAVGLNSELANRVFPNTGPFALDDRPGPGSGRGQFNGPRGIAVAPDDGATFVVDMGNARIVRFDEFGEFVGVWSSEDGGEPLEKTDAGLGPTGIEVSPDGAAIYVCDTWNHRIVVLDRSGRMVREFGSFMDTGDAPDAAPETGFFFGPRDVAITADEIYVVDTGNERVQVFGLDGTFRRAFGGKGSEPGQLIEPVGIALGADGRVYIADSGNARISVFAADGTPLEQWPVEAWLNQQYFEPYLAFDGAGNLYATSSATGSVEIFDPTGRLIESINQVGSEPLDAPVGVAAALDGTMLISDIRRSAVVRYAPVLPIPIGEDDEIIDEPLASPAPPEASPAASPDASPAVS